jgi:hypothetical protein
MDAEDPLPCSQDPATAANSQPTEANPRTHTVFAWKSVLIFQNGTGASVCYTMVQEAFPRELSGQSVHLHITIRLHDMMLAQAPFYLTSIYA